MRKILVVQRKYEHRSKPDNRNSRNLQLNKKKKKKTAITLAHVSKWYISKLLQITEFENDEQVKLIETEKQRYSGRISLTKIK